MKTAWSHLPNAKHIDRVLAHSEAHPEKWAAAAVYAQDAAYTAARAAANVCRVVALTAAHTAALTAARAAARDAARGAARDAAWDAAWDAAYTAARNAAWVAAWNAIAALVAWDNCAHLLELTPDQLRVYSRLSDDPAAVLLLPAVIVLKV